jgi:dienelactone hydrolase
MDSAGVSYQFINYPGAKHSFTNPEADIFAKKFDMPLAYNADADHKSWEDMKTFLQKIFSSK